MENTQKKAGQIAPAQPANTLDHGTYEIIRSRLEARSTELEQRLQQLNTARKGVFGSTEAELLANERIHTANFCIARDLFAFGPYCLFGYNVQVGLRAGIALTDVFSLYRREGHSFREEALSVLAVEKFQTDFQNLYRYYRDAFFVRFVQQDHFLYMVFQVSDHPGDIKVFKWLVREESLQYIDGRSEHELRPVRQFEFSWKEAGRDHHRKGRHPHVSIMDRLFVETVGGDLTIKVEDNTEDGQGIYREEVLHADQTLDDAEYRYADLGNLIVLKIRPYLEDFRYFVYNEKMQQVQRIDTLADSGVLLPDGQGLIFSNGYYLQTGAYKIFDTIGQGWRFDRRFHAPNGEDFLYSFYRPATGQFVLMAYNIIAQQVDTPVICHGFTLFPDGTLGHFRAEEEATKHHTIQLWRTPFGRQALAPQAAADSYLSKVGNKELVRAMAACREILTLAQKQDSYDNLYTDLVQRCTQVLDTYHWLDHPESFGIAAVLTGLRQTAETAIEEFEKKRTTQRATQRATREVQTAVEELLKKIRLASFTSIEPFVQLLAELRSLRGRVIALEALPYADPEVIAGLSEQLAAQQAELSGQCIDFLLDEAALSPYREQIDAHRRALSTVAQASVGKALAEAVDQTAGELQLLIDIVNELPIDDTTDATRIIDQISALFATLNQLRAAIRKREKELAGGEAQSAFQAQLKLLDQSTVNLLGLAETGKQCDDYLTKLMIQLEELETQFAEYDDFIPVLAEKREEIYLAFDERRQSLSAARQRRSDQLQLAAERILQGIHARTQTFQDQDELNSFFASDLMVEKVRDLIRQLQSLQQTNQAAGLQAQLKSLREEAGRQLKDRKELYVAGEQVIRLGRHHFDVNRQPLDLNIVERQGVLYYHLTGTNFYERIEDEELSRLAAVWSQPLVSENDEVYRAEYLAYQVFREWLQLEQPEAAELETMISNAVSRGFQEGYTKGIHDQDALAILRELVRVYRSADLLRYPAEWRALAYLVWHYGIPPAEQQRLQAALRGAGQLLRTYPGGSRFDYLQQQLREQIDRLVE